MASGPVLLHGFTGSAASWYPVIDGLRAAGHDPVTIDLPGHGALAGQVDPRHFTLDATLETIANAVRRPADVVGYSMGGRLALHFAFAFPERVRRLVVESASPGLRDPDARADRIVRDQALADRVVQDGIEAFVDRWEALPLFATQAELPAERRARQRATRLANDPESLAESLRGLGTGSLPSLWERLAAMDMPVLLIAGSEDHRFSEIAEEMAALLPGARLAIVPGAGHNVHLERHAQWTRAVAAFLAA